MIYHRRLLSLTTSSNTKRSTSNDNSYTLIVHFHRIPIAALTVPSHAASYSNRMIETDLIVAFAAEAIGRNYTFSASLHAMDSYT